MAAQPGQRGRLLVSTHIVAGLLILSAGCDELGLPSADSDTASRVSDTGDAADSNGVSATEPPPQPELNLPPLTGAPTDASSLSGLALAEWLTAKAPNEITDSDLRRVAEDEEAAGAIDSLDLRGAMLTADGIRALSRLPELRELDLTGCRFSQADWQVLGESRQLQVLSLESAAVGDATLAFLSQLTGLRTLNLRNTNLTDLAFEHLQTLSQLEELHLDGVRTFTGAGLEALGPNGADAPLRVLTATNTKIGVFGFPTIGTRKSLEVLVAGSASVGDDKLSALTGLRQLQHLTLGGNPISDQGLRVLSRLKQLTHLDISGSPRVSNATLRQIRNHKHLQVLRITGTSCDRAGASALKQEMPECEIHFGGTVL